MPKVDVVEIRNFKAGETSRLTITCKNKDTGVAKNPTAVSGVIFDPDRKITGTADSGSTTTLVDLTLATDWPTNSQLVGMTIEVTDATDGTKQETEITAHTGATGALTFGALSFTVAVGDTYEILGWPLLTWQAASDITTNTFGFDISPSNVLSRRGSRALSAHVTFSATDIAECYGEFSVESSKP